MRPDHYYSDYVDEVGWQEGQTIRLRGKSYRILRICRSGFLNEDAYVYMRRTIRQWWADTWTWLRGVS